MDYEGPPLKLKYSMLGMALVLLCAVISAYPIFRIEEWLSAFFDIQSNIPVKEQHNGALWVVILLPGAAMIFIACYTAVAFILCKVLGWSNDSYIKIFWKAKYPGHWYK